MDWLNNLSKEQLEELIAIQEELALRKSRRKIDVMFPDTGPLRRELYPKHLEFFRAGAFHRERLLMAGNRVGKTEAAGCECVYHLTGDYPEWWEGRRFNRPVSMLAAGDTLDNTRKIIVTKMLGKAENEWGTGLIPHESIIFPSIERWVGKPGMVSMIPVRHKSGGVSRCLLRSYDQGRRIFQGDEQDIIWLDEEVPYDVYEESLMRTMTTGGIVMMTFTPLNGLTDLVVSFMDSMQTQASLAE